MGIYNDKHRLFDDYEKELNSFREAGCEVSPSESNAKCEAYISSSECTWKNIFAPDTGELVGFLIYGKTGAFKHPDADGAVGINVSFSQFVSVKIKNVYDITGLKFSGYFLYFIVVYPLAAAF